MDKATLRALYLKKRKTLSEVYYHKTSLAIAHHFFDRVCLNTVNVLHVYWPMLQQHEPDTRHIIDRIMKKHAAIQLVLPKVDLKNNQLHSLAYQCGDKMVANRWGVVEPIHGEPVSEKSIDLVIIPLLTFDRKGGRIGYGKGYYDKFLVKCPSHCQRIGLSFFPPLDYVPQTKHDIRIDKCITPTGVYLCTQAM